MVRRGSAVIAEQGSIGELRGDGAPASSIETPKAKSPSKPKAVAPKQSAFKDKPWSDFPDDPPESFNTAIPDTVPMAKSEPTSVPGSLNPSAAAVAVPRPGSSASGKFYYKPMRKTSGPQGNRRSNFLCGKRKMLFSILLHSNQTCDYQIRVP